MPRALRNAVGGLAPHALNRESARLTVFRDETNDDSFLRILDQAVARPGMRLLASYLMPHHFHLLVGPRGGRDHSQ